MGRLIVALSLVVAACGGGSAGVTTGQPPATPASEPEVTATETPPGSPVQPVTTETPAEPGGSETTRARPEGPEAPDFVLALGQGGEFSLSGERKPVYMIFWAEW